MSLKEKFAAAFKPNTSYRRRTVPALVAVVGVSAEDVALLAGCLGYRLVTGDVTRTKYYEKA